MTATPMERTLKARMAAHVSWAQCDDRSARGANGQRGLMSSFEKQVDPDGVLEPADRARRAESARKAHFTRLALKSAQARRRRAPSEPVVAGGEQ